MVSFKKSVTNLCPHFVLWIPRCPGWPRCFPSSPSDESRSPLSWLLDSPWSARWGSPHPGCCLLVADEKKQDGISMKIRCKECTYKISRQGETLLLKFRFASIFLLIRNQLLKLFSFSTNWWIWMGITGITTPPLVPFQATGWSSLASQSEPPLRQRLGGIWWVNDCSLRLRVHWQNHQGNRHLDSRRPFLPKKNVVPLNKNYTPEN